MPTDRINYDNTTGFRRKEGKTGKTIQQNEIKPILDKEVPQHIVEELTGDCVHNPNEAWGCICMTEVVWNPENNGNEGTSPELNEYIKIFNNSAEDIDITDWSLCQYNINWEPGEPDYWRRLKFNHSFSSMEALGCEYLSQNHFSIDAGKSIIVARTADTYMNMEQNGNIPCHNLFQWYDGWSINNEFADIILFEGPNCNELGTDWYMRDHIRICGDEEHLWCGWESPGNAINVVVRYNGSCSNPSQKHVRTPLWTEELAYDDGGAPFWAEATSRNNMFPYYPEDGNTQCDGCPCKGEYNYGCSFTYQSSIILGPYPLQGNGICEPWYEFETFEVHDSFDCDLNVPPWCSELCDDCNCPATWGDVGIGGDAPTNCCSSHADCSGWNGMCDFDGTSSWGNGTPGCCVHSIGGGGGGHGWCPPKMSKADCMRQWQEGPPVK